MKSYRCKCHFCEKEYVGRNCNINLLKHIEHCLKNENSKKYICKCGRAFLKSQQFTGHLASCGKEKEKCEQCGKLFIRLKKHVCGKKSKKYKYNKVDPNCPYCNRFFENGFALGGHKTHCKLNPNKNETIRKISDAGKG